MSIFIEVYPSTINPEIQLLTSVDGENFSYREYIIKSEDKQFSTEVGISGIIPNQHIKIISNNEVKTCNYIYNA